MSIPNEEILMLKNEVSLQENLEETISYVGENLLMIGIKMEKEDFQVRDDKELKKSILEDLEKS